jgi:hypothetical protein
MHIAEFLFQSNKRQCNNIADFIQLSVSPDLNNYST